MRVAAGILMIVVGFTVFSSLYSLTELFGEKASDILVPITLSLLVITWGTAVGAFIKKRWKWALAEAMCSVFIAFTFAVTFILTYLFAFRSWASVLGANLLGIIFILMSILAVIFLIKRRGEFQS